MGKAYDGKKRWNETVLQTTDAASGAAGSATKKRYSGAFFCGSCGFHAMPIS
jgi:hypothetical protein